MGGVLDSTGNNYPGYNYTATRAVAYYNSLGQGYIDCSTYGVDHYVVNGNTFDVGWIGVSYWDIDYGTGNPIECFTAPNILLPYYFWPDPLYTFPGNLNFDWTEVFPGPPYNLYNFNCGGPLQLVMRGVLGGDTTVVIPALAVKFSGVKGQLDNDRATISWSNLTESDLSGYEVQKSISGASWQTIRTVLPSKNDGTNADYTFQTLQQEDKSFYRIKATENSGHIYYSTIIVLNKPDPAPGVVPDQSLSVYPNPVNGNSFTFRLTNADTGRYLFSIITPYGREIKQKMFEHNLTGDLTRQIQLSNLPTGLYRAVLRSERKKFTQTFFYGL
jgi:hypothetical protein